LAPEGERVLNVSFAVILIRRLNSRVLSSSMVSSGHQNNVPPVSLLAGFLGSGKTTTLSHLLTNRDNLKVGVIVNDVAAVNVDADVISRLLTREGIDGKVVDMIELENGCVCCGPEAGQLGPAVRRLCAQGEERGAPFDHIVIELSGVADPAAVRFNLAADDIEVARVITLVDANAFPALYHSWDVMQERKDLGGGEEASAADPCVAMKKVSFVLHTQSPNGHKRSLKVVQHVFRWWNFLHLKSKKRTSQS
jgi:G3E family GTPase